MYRRDLATNHINSGNAHAAADHPGEALAEFERRRTILQPLIDADLSDTENRRELAVTLFNIGDALRATGRYTARRANEQSKPARSWRRWMIELPSMNSSGPVRMISAPTMIDKGPATPSARDRARREDHAIEAMDALRRAIAGGYRAVDAKNFSALKARPDFQDLMRDLAFPEWPFAGEPNPTANNG